MDLDKQRLLGPTQISEFYHDLFVTTQLEHFTEICEPLIGESARRVVDVGGGSGYFAAAITHQLGLASRVIDMDAASVKRCEEIGVEAMRGDALRPPICGDEEVTCFNLILHHLIAETESATCRLQADALAVWRGKASLLFVNEYIYDSYIEGLSGKLIYAITSSRVLSLFGRAMSRFVPSLRANTFDVGVRFRGMEEWTRFFESNGWIVRRYKKGAEEGVSWARRLLLIKSCRRDSFVLQATGFGS